MKRLIHFAALCALVAAIIPHAAAQRAVTLFVPAFEGPGSLGRNVARILNLQVWQTLRKEPAPNPSHVNFGEGLIVWDVVPIDPGTHEQAARAAARQNADMTMWGRARPYGDGVVAESYLTIARGERTRVWQVSGITIEMPRLQYEFRPIVLDRKFVEGYSEPEAMKIYAGPNSREQVGAVGGDLKAIEQRAGAARVESQGKQGWVRMPALSATRSEVVDFVGGVIRILRSDWSGAAELFSRVLANRDTPTMLQLDAYLYRGLSAERSGSSGLADFRRARDLNPYDRVVCSYMLMCQLATANRTPAGPARAAIVADARKLLQSSRYLYPKGDPWLQRLEDALARVP